MFINLLTPTNRYRKYRWSRFLIQQHELTIDEPYPHLQFRLSLTISKEIEVLSLLPIVVVNCYQVDWRESSADELTPERQKNKNYIFVSL